MVKGKKDKFLRGRYLYDPQNNIELGCAYLGKLKNVYFKGINDEESTYHCVISAYNTGPGNVAKAFTGTTKLKPTITPDIGHNHDGRGALSLIIWVVL